MGLTVTPEQPNVVGREKHVRATVVFDSSYPTGGEAVAASAFGLGTITDIECEAGTIANVYYNAATGKLIASDGDSEIADTTNLSALSIRVKAIGRG